MIINLEYKSRVVKLGELTMGGKEPIRVQSMTNVSTMDTVMVVRQVKALKEAGCELVRLTARSLKEADNLLVIRNKLEEQGVFIPLAADIHFNPRIAERAAGIVHKVRLNPGNYIKDPDKVGDSIKSLTEICHEHGTVIRVGVNHGSLSQRILEKYGNTAEGMVASAMEFLELCRHLSFHELVVSMKSSHVTTMIKANIMLVEAMMASGMDYPVHLGVTEAGEGEDGRIRSAAGIGPLLQAGIGDTIRVSLTEDPVAEIPVARKLVESCVNGRGVAVKGFTGQKTEYNARYERAGSGILEEGKAVAVVGQHHATDDGLERDPDLEPLMNELLIDKAGAKYVLEEGKKEDPADLIRLDYSESDHELFMLRSVAELSELIIEKSARAYWLVNKTGEVTEYHPQIVFGVLQATGVRITGTEYVSCPGCGRTSFDLEGTLKKIKKHTTGLSNVKIAVMGCIVNGPGEMMDADYGYVGQGNGQVSLYHAGKAVKKNIREDDALQELLTLIKSTYQNKPAV